MLNIGTNMKNDLRDGRQRHGQLKKAKILIRWRRWVSSYPNALHVVAV